MLCSLNNDVIAKQKAQNRILSEQTDSVAAHNAALNSQLRRLIRHIDNNVQTANLPERLLTHGGYLGFSFFQVGLNIVVDMTDKTA